MLAIVINYYLAQGAIFQKYLSRCVESDGSKEKGVFLLGQVVMAIQNK
jgi:hypothetical protein